MNGFSLLSPTYPSYFNDNNLYTVLLYILKISNHQYRLLINILYLFNSYNDTVIKI